jgi:hypothetical protein
MPEPRLLRTAWSLAFLATLALIVGLGLARSAGAATTPFAAPLAAEIEAEDDFEEDELEEEEDEEACEVSADEDAEEAAETEEICAEEEEVDGDVPAECLLSSAVATVAADPAHGRVRLTVRYTAVSPAAVSVDTFLRGDKGPLSLGDDHPRFARSGVFHDTERLSERQMAKVTAARSFTVQLKAAGAPKRCGRYFERRLTLRRGLTWSEPAARPHRNA